MSDEMYRERIRSLEEHTDKLVAQSDALKAQLAERDAEIERLRQQVAELQANTRSLSAELERCNQLMLCPPLEAVTELSDWFDRFRGAYDK